jgi:large subunit ribosomal protein L23
MQPHNIIKRPIALTEKATSLRAAGKYVFEVDPGANRVQIREAIQVLFGVQVVHVNTLNVRGKDRRMGRGYGKLSNWKKAVVTLKPGQQIELFGAG